ncbi:hypothetical protein BAUCODRAFT_567079 [Baudoinia panamericana UAMH 10762]|uniref:Vesicle tethering protein Uso1/P115-like head domain-containing protein n=1 Tax=Baudoinia panamericana (strain UAMH 10762) TaxID=717646 RepID=M2NAC1_BAUPA|nr:uncharacterized protein BAUCODRAFT_567079 [Baudoinia panamericana UAMH 10762]EMD01169.1 hypothetical protein BAUCODRAFT_567079 [Baudoinia panamericana UAMH 10762]
MLKTPPLQTATATIETLCGRLQSTTLLEDRRAAVLGLRSFAKQYPASVASGSLRELIAVLRRDGVEGVGDVDTIRLVLETLLMLFNPDSNSPEASDEIAYFMADEFSMRQDNVTLLLSLLDPSSPYADYYSRLYSVQLLSAICAARPERLQECVLSAPLGVSRLVGTLDDGRDAVRNAGLLLLVDLTSGANEDLRKIVAFDDVFVKVFALIRAEGGLADAGVVAQDCLSLLANLIKGSASNQTMFRESGCVAQMIRLLQEGSPPEDLESAYVRQGREKAAWGLLQLLALFLEPGERISAQNQTSFFRAGAAQVLIGLAFSAELPPPIRTLALKDAAALIAANAPLQEAFAALQVETPQARTEKDKLSVQLNGTRSGPASARGSARPSAERPRTYIIEALLDLTLKQPQADGSLRAASCSVIQAYLTNHDRIKLHFLQRAIAGYTEHETAANVLITLLARDQDSASKGYASWVVSDLVYDSPDAKAVLAALKERVETEGEDVLTLIQALGSHLSTALQATEETLVAAYAGLITVLLWEFADGVDNLLAEGSGLLQALVTAINSGASNPVIAGFAAASLGTIYEFSTKDSPIPRRTLAPLLTQKLGRGKYLEALAQLRREPALRDFDVDGAAHGGLLSRAFVDLFLVEYSRLRKAIDKDPAFEVLPLSAAEGGVDRDVLDDLRQQLQTVKDALEHAQRDATASSQQHEQDRLSASKDLQTANAEIDRLRRINQAMQQGHEAELGKLAQQHESQRAQLSTVHQRTIEHSRQEAARQIETRLREQGAAAAQKIQEYERRLVELGNSHRSEQGKHVETVRQLEAITARHAELGTSERTLREQLNELNHQHGKMAREHQQLQTRSAQMEVELEKLRADGQMKQERITLLTAQLNDLREELKAREDELATERAGFEDLEKELEGAKAALSANSQPTEAAEKLAELEMRYREAQENEKSAKDEMESMLLVMSDIEAKRDAYRSKVKELGGDVTEDEEDAEDGEDEDDKDVD